MTAASALTGVLMATDDNGVVRLVQWCVIAFIFLFFLRVVRAVWVEVSPVRDRQPSRRPTRAEAPPREAARRRRGALVLEVVEPSDHATLRYDLARESTIGRSPGCAIATTYDVYSSSEHARLFHEDGRLYVEDLDSTNGTFVNSERISEPTRLERGDQLQVGETVFEVTR